MSDDEDDAASPAYRDNPRWSDIEPLPQDDGGPNALAKIAYPEEYSEASSYLRAVMAKNEHSDRALDLTAHMVELNPSHYTVWIYRASILEKLDKDIERELEWLNEVSLRHIKNYQIWNHRQVLVTRLSEQIADGKVEGGAQKLQGVMRDELAFLQEMFENDVKNYHVWSYRQWLVRKFDLWEGFGELEEVERFLRSDIRNNSAWNHRWFLVFGRERDKSKGWKASEDIWQREVDYAKEAIRLAPQNESAWSYLTALIKKNELTMASLTEFAKEFAAIEDEDVEKAKVRCTFALDVLAEAYAEKQETKPKADFALMLLSERYDPIRKNYWAYKRKVLELGSFKPPTESSSAVAAS